MACYNTYMMYALDELAADPGLFATAVHYRLPFRPLLVKIKITPHCNLRCEMCNHWRRPYGASLETQRWRDIIAELAELGCRKLHISGGEPLLQPDTIELVGYATTLGIRVNMTSNGTLIDKDTARALIEAGLRAINISLDSPDRKTHERVRGVEGGWKKTTHAIEHLNRWRSRGKLTIIRVNTVVSRLNYDSLATLPALVHQLGADALNLIGVDAHCGSDLRLPRRRIAIYNEEIAPHIAEQAVALGLMDNEEQAYPFGREPRDILYTKEGYFARGWYKRHPCFAPWTHCLLDYNGDVFPCCMMRGRIPALGNVGETSFSAVWAGIGYRNLRDAMHHPPAFEACSMCDDFLAENKQIFTLVQAEMADLPSSTSSTSSTPE